MPTASKGAAPRPSRIHRPMSAHAQRSFALGVASARSAQFLRRRGPMRKPRSESDDFDCAHGIAGEARLMQEVLP
jgi:hypothetical protein